MQEGSWAQAEEEMPRGWGRLRRSDRNSSSIQPTAGMAGRLLALSGMINSKGFTGLKMPGLPSPLLGSWDRQGKQEEEEGLKRKVGVTTLPEEKCAATTPDRGAWLVRDCSTHPAGVCPFSSVSQLCQHSSDLCQAGL